ncbi:MFS transporter [Novosphingobium sp. M1R2S20]|uniref:MFS transporter n=1 Tax=Novosphingobium rhizovicinum TaxID=3228928 RepID=A0ABV3RH42_9SPHN
MQAQALAADGDYGPPIRARDEWVGGWPVVLAGFAGSALASMYAYTMGVMIGPLEAEFGWTRAEISSGFFVVSLFSVTFSLVMGMVIDRVGPRRLAIFGVVFYCAAVMLLSQATSSLQVWWALWALVAVGILFIKPTVWVAAISSLFSVSRGLALAVVLSATGFVSFIMPILTLLLLKELGWRMTYVALGGGSLLLVLPLVLLFFSSASDRDRRREKNRASVEAGQGAPLPSLAGLTLRQGLLSRNFALLAGGGFIFTLASVALTLNIVPILVDQRMSKEAAAAIAGAIGVAQIVGRLSGGYLLDRFNARLVAAVSVALPLATCALLLSSNGNPVTALVAVVFLGFAAGAEMDAIAYLSAKCFGLRNFGALFGAFTGLITLGFGLGPMLANAIYDRTGSYELVLWIAVPLVMLSALTFLLIGPYPTFDAPSEAS